MLKTIVRVCQIAFFALGAATLCWFLVSKYSGERQRELDPWERTLATRAVDALVEEIPRRDAMKRLLVMPVRGDLDERVTALLLDRIRTRPEYDIIDARRYPQQTPPTDLKTALEFAEGLRKGPNPDGILFTEVERVTPRNGVGTKIDIQSRLVPVVSTKDEGTFDKARRMVGALFPSLAPDDAKLAETTGEVVHPPAQEITSRFSIDWWSGEMEQTPSLLRLALWALVVGGLPFAFFPVVQTITHREDNRLNAVMLSSFVALDMVAAFTLEGLRIGFFGFVLVVLAGLAGFIYDFVICDKIDEMRK